MSLTCGTLVATRLSYHRKILTAFIVWVITAAALSPFLYWIVIDKAATDNLIELMAGHGTAKAAMLLSLYLATIVFEGALLAGQTQQRLRGLKLATLIALVLSVPIACLAIYYGTEQHVEKYGKTFSALQFLLSRDRENYAQAFELMARYFVFHAAIVSLVFMIQYPFFSGLFGSANRSGREKDRSTNSGLTRMDEQ
jgi:glucan phosphoethanolaminetransferase (alkaline phosphatase superfamily)